MYKAQPFVKAKHALIESKNFLLAPIEALGSKDVFQMLRLPGISPSKCNDSYRCSSSLDTSTSNLDEFENLCADGLVYIGTAKEKLASCASKNITGIVPYWLGVKDSSIYYDLVGQYTVVDSAGVRRILFGNSRLPADYTCRSFPPPPKVMHHTYDLRSLLDLLVHRINVIASPLTCCRYCGRVIDSDTVCSRCKNLLAQGRLFLDGVVSSWLYDEWDTLALAIKWYKGHKRSPLWSLALPLVHFYLRDCFRKLATLPDFDANSEVIAVTAPSSSEALTRRGFDHVQELLHVLCFSKEQFFTVAQRVYPSCDWKEESLRGDLMLKLICPPEPVLRKRDKTEIKLIHAHGDRLRAVEGLYSVVNSDFIAGRVVCLLDDVVASGATLNECARVLKGAGAERVYGVALCCNTARVAPRDYHIGQSHMR